MSRQRFSRSKPETIIIREAVAPPLTEPRPPEPGQNGNGVSFTGKISLRHVQAAGIWLLVLLGVPGATGLFHPSKPAETVNVQLSPEVEKKLADRLEKAVARQEAAATRQEAAAQQMEQGAARLNTAAATYESGANQINAISEVYKRQARRKGLLNQAPPLKANMTDKRLAELHVWSVAPFPDEQIPTKAR